MHPIFETFKPENALVSKYVDYYYLDIKPNNVTTEFDCFPHYNTTISLYKSNVIKEIGEIIYEDNGSPLQIFTPIRKSIFHVRQLGKIHRLVIVFKPLGIQQFYKHLDFTDFIVDHDFFTNTELTTLFATEQTTLITKHLDQYLLNRFVDYKNTALEASLILIFNNLGSLPIQLIATKITISRRHLNRLFNAHFGISVKKFNEIVLFRKTLEKKLFETTEQSFTDLAYEFKYCDQSHLIKAFQNFTLNSPKHFFKKGTHLGNEDTFWHLKK